MKSDADDRSWILSAVLRFRKPLIAYSASLIKDVDRARDVVQEIFLKLCADDLVVDRQRLEPWLFKVCRNLSIDILRRERRMTAIDNAPERQSTSPAIHELLEQRQDAEAILQLVAMLPPNQQEVLRLKFLHDLSYREISEVTELSVGNVGYLIHVGVKTIREQLHAAEGARLARSEMSR